MLEEFDYQNKCWWCGGSASTREHKQKKTDFIREFGVKRSNSTIRINNKGEKIVQGPDSKFLKYEKPNLCAPCNSVRSQPFDYAWDEVIRYISDKSNNQYLSSNIDFREIGQSNYYRIKLNFLRYLVKHVSCRIAALKLKVPLALLDFLNCETDLISGIVFHAFYRIDIEILNDLSESLNIGKYPFLGIRAMNGYKDSSGRWLNLYSGITIGAIEFRYTIDYEFTEEKFPGLTSYYKYPYFPVAKIWDPLELFESKLERYNVNNIPKLSDTDYQERAYRIDFYKWFKNRSY